MKLSNIISSYNPCDFYIRPPFVIAEAGVNHEGSMDLAKRLVDEAAEGGAQAIKFQSYKAHKIASKHSPSYWDTSKEPTRSQYELFKKYDKFWRSEYEELSRYCESAGIEFLSTPFDNESADFLNDMMDVYKISSSDITNLPFIEHLCQYNKPIILSTGASNLSEIFGAMETIKKYDIPVCLMHCVLNYPTENKNAHLGMIRDLIQKFPMAVPGYSDHTLPQDMEVLRTAVLLGAFILEKHFTHDKSLQGNDHYHAMDKEDLKVFFNKMKHQFTLLGEHHKHALPSEDAARRNARRSLVLNKAIKQGEKITKDHLTWKRPASGISPAHIEEVIGRSVNQDLEEDQILEWNYISQ